MMMRHKENVSCFIASIPPVFSFVTRLLSGAALLFSIFTLLLAGLSTPVSAQMPGSGGYGGPGSGGSGGSSSPPAVAYWRNDTQITSGTATFTPSAHQPISRPWSAPDVTTVEQQQNLYGTETGTLTPSGVYHVKFTWVSTAAHEPAPRNVIVAVASHADWHGPASSAGTADNGLGKAQIPAPDGSAGDSTSTKYYVEDGYWGLVEFDVHVSSTVTATGVVPPGTPSYAANSYLTPLRVTRNLSPSIHIVNFNLHGTTPDHLVDNILIGQTCVADLTTDLDPNLVTIGNYSWSVSGMKFHSFDVSQDQEIGQLYGVPSLLWSRPQPNWCWTCGESVETVTYTADVIVNEQSIGSISDDRLVFVYEPYYSFNHVSGPVSYSPNQSDVHAGAPDFNVKPGMRFIGSVGTPNLFRKCSNISHLYTPQNGTFVGEWGFLQLCSLQHALLEDGNLVHIFPYWITTVTDNWLDSEWPYDSSFKLADSTSDEHTEDFADDSPALLLGGGFIQFVVDDTYKMHLMYHPPLESVGRQWVPLHRLTWHWTANGSRLEATFSKWAPDPPNGAVSVSEDARCKIHPEWEHKWANTAH